MLLIPEDVYIALVSNAKGRCKANYKESFSRDKDLQIFLLLLIKKK